jgi:hypothetical protein
MRNARALRGGHNSTTNQSGEIRQQRACDFRHSPERQHASRSPRVRPNNTSGPGPCCDQLIVFCASVPALSAGAYLRPRPPRHRDGTAPSPAGGLSNHRAHRRSRCSRRPAVRCAIQLAGPELPNLRRIRPSHERDCYVGSEHRGRRPCRPEEASQQAGRIATPAPLRPRHDVRPETSDGGTR